MKRCLCVAILMLLSVLGVEAQIGSWNLVWREDFGVAEDTVIRDFADNNKKVIGHTCAASESECTTINDMYYGIANSTWWAYNRPKTCNAEAWHFMGGRDHTGNEKGAMLIVNAGNDSKDKQIYQQQINFDLCQNKKYRFVIYAASITNPDYCEGSPTEANLTMNVYNIKDPSNPLLLKTLETGDIPLWEKPLKADGSADQSSTGNGFKSPFATREWSEFKIEFTAGDGDKLQLEVINHKPGGCGNDFVIDDISLYRYDDKEVLDPTISTSTVAQESKISSSGCAFVASFSVPDEVLEKWKEIYTQVYFLWQRSNDGGVSWINMPDVSGIEKKNIEWEVPNDQAEIYRVIITGATSGTDAKSEAEYIAEHGGPQNGCSYYSISNTIAGISPEPDCSYKENLKTIWKEDFGVTYTGNFLSSTDVKLIFFQSPSTECFAKGNYIIASSTDSLKKTWTEKVYDHWDSELGNVYVTKYKQSYCSEKTIVDYNGYTNGAVLYTYLEKNKDLIYEKEILGPYCSCKSYIFSFASKSMSAWVSQKYTVSILDDSEKLLGNYDVVINGSDPANWVRTVVPFEISNGYSGYVKIQIYNNESEGRFSFDDFRVSICQETVPQAVLYIDNDKSLRYIGDNFDCAATPYHVVNLDDLNDWASQYPSYGYVWQTSRDGGATWTTMTESTQAHYCDDLDDGETLYRVVIGETKDVARQVAANGKPTDACAVYFITNPVGFYCKGVTCDKPAEVEIVSSDKDKILCPDGETTLSVKEKTTATGVFDYLWFKDEITDDADAKATGTDKTSTLTVGHADAGKYVLLVRDNSQPTMQKCWQTAEIEITAADAPKLKSIEGSDEFCFGEKKMPQVTYSFEDGTAPYEFTYKLNANGTETSKSLKLDADKNVYSPAAPVITGTPEVQNTFIYSLSKLSDANGCVAENSTKSATITVNPVPTAKITAVSPMCEGNDFTLEGMSNIPSATLLWSKGDDRDVLTETTITNATVADAGTYYLTTSTDKCTSEEVSGVVTIYNQPKIDKITVSPTEVCSGEEIEFSPVIINKGTGTESFLWEGTQTGNNEKIVVSKDVTDETEVSEKLTYTIKYSSTVSCTATSAVSKATVHSIPNAPDVSVWANPVEYCKGSTAKKLSAVGENLAWYDADGTLLTNAPTPSTDSEGETFYMVSQTVNGCESDKATVTIKINPLPTPVITASSESQCYGVDRIVLGLDGKEYASQTWTGSVSVLDDKTKASPVIAKTTAAGTYTFAVSVKDNNGCEASAETTKTIIIFPKPIASISALPTAICNLTTTNLTAVVSETDGTGVWTNAEEITETTASFSASKDGNAEISYVFTSENGCVSDKATTTVTVYKIPEKPVVDDKNPKYCQNASTQQLSAKAMNSTSVLTWLDAEGHTLAEAPTPSSAEVKTMQFGVKQTDNGCSSAEEKIEVVINPLPSPIITLDKDGICEGETVTLGLNGVKYKTYNWTYSPSSTVVMVRTDKETPSFLSTAPVGTYTIGVTVTDDNNCKNSAEEKTLKVNAIPTASISISDKICVDGGTVQTKVESVSPEGGIGVFSVDGGGKINSETGVFNPAESGAGTYTVSYDYTSSSADGSCKLKTPATASIQVINKPEVQLAPASSGRNYACESGTNSTEIKLTASVSPEGGSYVYSCETASVDEGTGSLIPSSSNVGTHTVKAVYTDKNGCSNETSLQVHVYSLPDVKFADTNPENVCVKSSEYTLAVSPTSPGVGTFSGDVTSNIFNPATVGQGKRTVKYTYEDEHGCTNSANYTVTVVSVPMPKIDGGNTKTIVRGSDGNLSAEPNLTAIVTTAGDGVVWEKGNVLETTDLELITGLDKNSSEGSYPYSLMETRVISENTTCYSDALTGTVVISDCPAKTPLAENVYECVGYGDRIVLEATPADGVLAAGNKISWFADDPTSNKSATVIKDNSLSVTIENYDVSMASEKIFYVAEYDDVNSCWSGGRPVKLTIVSLPDVKIEAPKDVCSRDGIVNISVSPANGTFDNVKKVAGFDEIKKQWDPTNGGLNKKEKTSFVLKYTAAEIHSFETTSLTCEKTVQATIVAHYIAPPNIIQINESMSWLISDIDGIPDISATTSSSKNTITWYSDEQKSNVLNTDGSKSLSINKEELKQEVGDKSSYVKSYWVSQTDAYTCESELVEVKLNLIDCPFEKPNVSNQIVCSGQELQDIEASVPDDDITPNSWKWYDENGDVVNVSATYNHSAPNDVVGKTNFKVSYVAMEPTTGQLCESKKADVFIDILPLPEITLKDRFVCHDEGDVLLSVASLNVHDNGIGSGTWSVENEAGAINEISGVIRSDFKQNTSGEYTVAYNYVDGKGCEQSETMKLTVQYVEKPVSQGHTSIVTENMEPEVSATLLENATVNWYSAIDDNVAKSHETSWKPGIAGNKITEKTYYASQTVKGCESERSSVLVKIVDCPFDAPEILDVKVCLNASSVENLIASTSETVEMWQWYNSANEKIDNNSSSLKDESVVNTEGNTTFKVNYFAIEPVTGRICPSDTAVTNIIVLPLPEISFDQYNPTLVCYDQQNVVYEADVDVHDNGIGAGVWSIVDQTKGIDSKTGVFYPSSLEQKTALYTIRYDYTDDFGCSNYKEQQVKVLYVSQPQTTEHYSMTTENRSVVLEAKNIESESEIKWYSALDDVIVLSTKNPWTTADKGNVAVSKEYYASQTISGCESERSVAKVEIVPCPVPNVKIESSEICVYENAPELKITLGEWLGRNEKSSINIYDSEGELLQNIAIDDLSFTPSIEGAGTYVFYAEEYNSQPYERLNVGCSSPSKTKATVIVKETPMPVVKVGNDICYGDAQTPTCSAMGVGELTWYEEDPGDYYSNKSTVISTNVGPRNNPINDEVGTHPLWVLMESDGCFSKATKVEYTIKPRPDAPETEGCEVCYSGENSTCSVKVISEINSKSSVAWYLNSDKKGTKLSMKSEYIPNIVDEGEYKYYAAITTDGCEGKATEAVITIKPLPRMPKVKEQGPVCVYEKAPILEAEGENLIWYESDKTTEIDRGETLQTTDMTPSSKIIYVSQTVDGCEGAKASVTYNVIAQPANPSPIGASICEGSKDIPYLTTNLSLDKWYADSEAKKYLATGYNYRPDSNSVGNSSITFYVVREQRGCHSDTVPVVLNVIRQPIFSIGEDTIVCVYDSTLVIQATDFVPAITEASFVGWTVSDGKKSQAFVDNEEHNITPESMLNTVGSYKISAFYRYKYENVSCNSDTISIKYTINKRARTPIVFAKVICQGEEIKDLQALGSPNMTWNSLDGIVPQYVSGPIYKFQPGQMLDTGVYRFEVYDIDYYNEENGCLSLSDTVSLTVAPGAMTSLYGVDSVCVGGSELYYTQYTSGSKYVWNVTGDNINYSKDAQSTSVRYVDWLKAGIDTLTVYEQTWAGCEGFDTLVVKIAPYPNPSYSWSMPGMKNVVEFVNTSVQDSLWYFEKGDSVAIPISYSMRWNFGHQNESENSIDTIIPYEKRNFPLLEGDYEYGYNCPVLTVVNDFGCKDSYTDCIFVDISSALYMPTAFAPANPAHSVRTFAPKGFNLKTCEVSVFDKWGNLLWYSNEVVDGVFVGAWDGRYDGKMMESDIYIWKMEATFLDGRIWEGFDVGKRRKSKYGSVTLLR
ncbi:MAG: hypothetical protein MJ198_04580 [Bacteroidales bacterium]|nr:hypothetical protein [Bacteroidales bacterium]